MAGWAFAASLVRLVMLGGALIFVPLLYRWAGGKARTFIVLAAGILFLIFAESRLLIGVSVSGKLLSSRVAWNSVYIHAIGYLAVILGVIYWVRDIQQARYELTRDNVNLKQAATTDFLTELVNRRYATLHLKRELSLARRSGVPLGFVMMDLDHFKRVNDTHGHQAGDAVLAHAGKVLKRRMRASDIVVRYGGEEFLVVLPGADLASTAKVANDLRQTIETSPATIGSQELPVTASFGAAVVQPGGNISVDDIIKRADEALYAAKAAGRNRVVTWAELTNVQAGCAQPQA
jgi:diguanylate cyclase (GGDEF)-like protein